MPQAEDDDRVGEVAAARPRLLSIEEQLQVKQIKDLEQEFLSCLDRLAKQKGGSTRALSLARTNMQQARMWALEEVWGDSRPSG